MSRTGGSASETATGPRNDPTIVPAPLTTLIVRSGGSKPWPRMKITDGIVEGTVSKATRTGVAVAIASHEKAGRTSSIDGSENDVGSGPS